jgi:DNA-binding Lrp family transcriptional regulator
MGIETRDEYAYSGLHAYVLVRHVSAEAKHPDRNTRGFVEEFRDGAGPEGPVTSVVEAAGAFKVLVHLRFGDGDGPMDALQSFLLEDRWDGVEYDVVLEGPSYTGALNELIGFKRHTSTIVAIVKVWVEHGRAREVLGRLGDELGGAFHGASIVFGDCDILLALEGDDVKSVAAAALGRLQRIDGITRTETSFTDWRRFTGGGAG